MRVKAINLVLAFLVGAGACVCAAQDFSADVFYLPDATQRTTDVPAESSGRNPSRLFVSKDKMRLEAHDQAGVVLIIDSTDGSAFALIPAKKQYEPLDGRMSEYFHVADAENACLDWEKSAAQKINCERAGHETVNGRQTVKYVNKGSSDSAISAVWIDVSLKFVVKWESTGTAAELRNIQEGQQSADLFTLPADYEIPKPRKGNNKGFSGR